MTPPTDPVPDPNARPQAPEPPSVDGLRQRIANAIRDAACPGDCGQSEEQCREQRIQPLVWHFGVVAEVEGTPEQIANALLPLFAAEREAVHREGLAEAIDRRTAGGGQ